LEKIEKIKINLLFTRKNGKAEGLYSELNETLRYRFLFHPKVDFVEKNLHKKNVFT